MTTAGGVSSRGVLVFANRRLEARGPGHARRRRRRLLLQPAPRLRQRRRELAWPVPTAPPRSSRAAQRRPAVRGSCTMSTAWISSGCSRAWISSTWRSRYSCRWRSWVSATDWGFTWRTFHFDLHYVSELLWSRIGLFPVKQWTRIAGRVRGRQGRLMDFKSLGRVRYHGSFMPSIMM